MSCIHALFDLSSFSFRPTHTSSFVSSFSILPTGSRLITLVKTTESFDFVNFTMPTNTNITLIPVHDNGTDLLPSLEFNITLGIHNIKIVSEGFIGEQLSVHYYTSGALTRNLVMSLSVNQYSFHYFHSLNIT
jgi:hypothetical protein